VFETDTISNQYRFGGDMTGLRENLDYIQGIGIKVSKALCSFDERN
jgi:alpha-1,3-glucan synthase